MLAQILQKLSLSALLLHTSTTLAIPVKNQELSVLRPRANTGRATWFNPGLGACEEHHGDDAPIVALSPSHFSNARCGQWITITAGGHSVRAAVMDLCPVCGENDVDCSPSIFQQLFPEEGLGLGVGTVQWSFDSDGGSSAAVAPVPEVAQTPDVPEAKAAPIPDAPELEDAPTPTPPKKAPAGAPSKVPGKAPAKAPKTPTKQPAKKPAPASSVKKPAKGKSYTKSDDE